MELEVVRIALARFGLELELEWNVFISRYAR